MERNALFQFAMDNILEIVVVFDTTGNIHYANRAAIQHLEFKESLHGRVITDIFPGDFEIRDNRVHFMEEPDESIREMMAYRENRTCFSMKAKVFVYRPYPEVNMYICSGYDSTDRNFLEKKANQAVQDAEEAMKVKAEFVANVTHELRTPVNGILGNTKELIGIETEIEKLKLLGMVERGCRDMNSIINNILDFSKLEAGKFVLELRKFRFRNMIDYVKGNHSNRITEKGLEFSITVSPEIPECIIGDELRIVQVLNNLISNAYKFTSVGSIHVEIVKTAQIENRAELFFMVMDTGIGIAKTDQDKLFKSFSQVDASISRKYGGTGLGLNICKQLVELMGGNIHVESEAGRGSVFSFHIWIELPDDCEGCEQDCKVQGRSSEAKSFDMSQSDVLLKLQSINQSHVSEKIWEFGEPENREEIQKKMSKLILCVEMENWEKAEMFAETVKQLVEAAPREVKTAALRMKMSVQKGDYEKSVAAFDTLQKMVEAPYDRSEVE